ncbi:GAF and ANTAR domain-containing protein [Streptomyces sp. NPDC002564]|uniref:GAF and ANTAR domain-containing protein n=1 Tax=Streptomyces sp. NPDC002564 TaxID=3364649 RepID=UPI003685F25E
MDFLQDLTARCVDLLGIDAASVLLVDERGLDGARDAGAGGPGARGAPGPVSASDERTRKLELAAFLRGEGPSLDTCVSGAALPDVDLGGAAAAERWPWFAAEARTAGFAAVRVLSLRGEPRNDDQAVGSEWGIGTRVVGALGLFRTGGAAPLSEDDVAFAQTLADLAAVTVARQRSLERSLVECGQLQAALTSRIAIEQAKGVLAERWQCSVDDAFAALRRHARHERVRLGEFARQVVTGEFDTSELRRQ